MWHLPHRPPAWVPLAPPRRATRTGECGWHGSDHAAGGGADSTHEEAEGLRGGVSADYVPDQQAGLIGAGERQTRYFKLVDLPGLFPVLPASAATLLRDVTVEEAVSLFHKFVGKNLTEDLVIRILEAYVPMKIQLRQEEVWASQFQRNKACIGTQRMHRLDAGHSDYKFMCKACGTGWPEAAKQCWVCPGKVFVPFQAPSATYEADGLTYSLGAAGPGGTRAQGDRNLVDGTVLAKTDTADEITMADAVPLNRRVDIRQEILSMEADDEALKVRESQEIKVKVQRSLKAAEAQNFQLYHPQVDQAIRKKEELHKALREHRRKELVTDEMLDNEMAILAPLHAGPAVRGGGQ